MRGPDCSLFVQHMKEKEEAPNQPDAPVNALQITSYVVTRSLKEGTSHELSTSQEGTELGMEKIR